MRKHVPVLKNEALFYLKASEGGVFFDGTFGQGGHAEGILKANIQNIVYSVDRDPSSEEFAEKLKKNYPERFYFVVCRFSQAFRVYPLEECDGFLLDLGLNQGQLFAKGRGFSFFDDLSLDCRINPAEKLISGEAFINRATKKELVDCFKKGGLGFELPFVVNSILSNRPIKSSKELGDIVLKAIPRKLLVRFKSDPRAVVLQALRMFINKEVEETERFLSQLEKKAKNGSRLVIISFHSLEDKLVTATFRRWAREKQGLLLTKAAVKPSDLEVETNPSSRSALLRSFEFRTA